MLRYFTAPITQNRLSILIYHQVLAQKDPLRPSVPTVEEFERQIRLVRRYFKPVRLAEAAGLMREGRLPGNAVAVTFDDGYRNNLELAAPVLARYGVPATFFVTTGFSDIAMWNDQVIELIRACQGYTLNLERLGGETLKLDSLATCHQAIETILRELKYRPWRERYALVEELIANHRQGTSYKPMMSAQEVRKLYQQGFEIGGHTHDHPILAMENKAEQRHQIQVNKQRLEEITGAPIRGFAYPNGHPEIDFDEISVNVLRELAFDYAVTTVAGVSHPQTDPYRLHRFTPWDRHMGKFYLRLLHNALTG